MTLRTCERWLTAASWIASIVHLVWFYFDQRKDSPSAWSALRACMDMGYWWEFVTATTPGAVTAIAAIVLAVAQSVVMIVRMRRDSAAAAAD